MKLLDLIKTSNSNLLRSKLRTILTLLAIIVGAFTLTLTLGIGEGTKDFVDQQTKSLTVENSIIVQPKSDGGDNPFSSDGGAREYNPNKGFTGYEYLRDEDGD